jgi:hypothetical protein
MPNRREDSTRSRLSLRRLSQRNEAKRKFVRGLVLRAVVASVAACAAAVPALAQTYPLPAPTYVAGSANATITTTFTVAPAAGSTVSCSLSLISSDARGPSDTNSTSASVSGSTAVCSITMYYYWRLTTPSSDTMTIAYSVQGPVQSSSGLVNIIPQPAAGTALNLTINVTQ